MDDLPKFANLGSIDAPIELPGLANSGWLNGC